jgi:hypothetical protein
MLDLDILARIIVVPREDGMRTFEVGGDYVEMPCKVVRGIGMQEANGMVQRSE